MRRIYTSVPHPRYSTPLNVIPYRGSYSERRPTNVKTHTMVDDILSMSYYSEPSAKTIGRGHLACVTYAGGRGYPRRKHLFSDEYRDIGDEIKTRSYYNNSYNKAYVDAMSLPTGYASYLLRIKPPEKNGTLTSLEKMHLIALSEERKKNQTKDKTNDTISKRTETPKTIPSKLDSTNDEKVSQKLKDDKISEPYISKVSSSQNESMTEIQTKGVVETPINNEIITEEICAKKPVDSSKSDKKTKSKKSNISKMESIPGPVIPVPDKTNVPINENPPEKTHEPESITLSSQEQNVEIEKIQVNEPEEEVPASHDTEPIKSTEEVTQESDPCDMSKGETLLETKNIQSETENKQEPVIETEPNQEDLVVETIVEDSTPVEAQDNLSNECLQTVAETTPSETCKQDEELEKEIQDSQTLEINNQTEEMDALQCKENLVAIEETQNTVDEDSAILQETNIDDPNKDESQLTSHIETPLSNAGSKAIEVSNPESESVNIEGSSPEIPTDTTLECHESITPQGNKAENTDEIIDGNKDETNNLRPSESNDNIIEEVIDSSSNEFHKDDGTEPLIEEPQSPEIITEKSTSNVICEVLSDVAEE